jgi:inner membrane transporter RhtA
MSSFMTGSLRERGWPVGDLGVTVEDQAPMPARGQRGGGCEACRVHRTKVVPAPVLVVGAVASVQSGAAVATKLFPAVGPGGAVFLRLALSAVIVGMIVRPPVRRTERHDLRLVVGFGLVLAAMNALFYLSIDRIPLGVAVTFEFLGPLGVAIGGSRRRLDVLWVVLAAVGVALLTGGGGRLDVVGIVLAMSAGICWAAYILLSQRVGQAFAGMTGLAIALTVGAVAIAPYGIAVGGTALARPSILGKGLAVAVLSSAIPYALELAALRRLRAAVFGVLMSIEPAVAALSGAIVLDQHLRWHEWIAVGAVMIASVGATSVSDRKPGEALG